MKGELVSEFGVAETKASVIPFGVNSTVPNTALAAAEARRQLGLGERDKTLLFFGNIAPYKGLEFLVAAFIEIAKKDSGYRLIIAGRPKGSEAYWEQLQATIARSGVNDRVIQKIEYVPDAQTEVYFKAADVLVLPYVHVFQSGVLFLGYNFGLPVIAADVGSLKEEIVEGKTGFVFQAGNIVALALAIENYFAGDLYRELNSRRREIQDFANERYSWGKVAAITTAVYSKWLRPEQNSCPHCAAEKL
jgi:glycosyltransferase involved in cell wall biosynthesis